MIKTLHLRLGVFCALAAVSLAPLCKADVWDKKTKVSVNSPIEVPGAVLTPGTYIFKLVNSQSNRHIVQIMNEDENRTFALTFTSPAFRLDPKDKTVLTFYEAKGDRPRAVRAWFYPGDVDGQEFVYGKDQSRYIPIAYTPQLEPVQTSTKEESTTAEVTTPEPAPPTATASTSVSPAPETATQTPPAAEEPIQLAQAQPPAQTQDQPAPPAAAPAEPASSDQLPKTASDLPLIALCGFMAIALALGLRRWDRSTNH
jgi:hypothetical protein